jgi:uncharacterized phage infection (PIP) family protein YhgE
MDEAAKDASGSADQWLEATLDQVFITPRVVDERAFEELSGSLKGLVKDALTQSRALITTTGEVKLLSDQLREATRELQSRVETAAKVVPTLDSRVTRAEQLLERTGKELAAKVTEVRESAARAVTLDRDRIEKQVRDQAAAILEQAVAEQVNLLRAKIGAAVQESQAQAEAQAAAIVDRLDDARRRLDAELGHAESRARGIFEGLESALGAVEKRSAKAAEQAIAAQAALDASALDAGVRLGAAVAEADRRAEVICGQAEGRMAELRRAAVEVVDLVARTNAEDVLATVQDATEAAARSESAAAELRGLVGQASELKASCESALARFGDLTAQAETSGRQLEQAVQGARSSIDSLSSRMTQLRTDYERLVQEAPQWGEQVRQMGAWLGQLLAQADQIGRGLDRLLRQAEDKKPGAASHPPLPQ